MPATTSPYQGNDYQAVSTYRPYQLPINDIFKAISAQNTYWEQGAQRVKSVYDNALNLDLTLEENKKIRDDYMKEAEKQLSKLSSMDLSDPSVQRQGFEIFRPLFKDQQIIMDDHLTNLQKTIFADADRYKKDEKTKGEGFHTDNLTYALKQFKGFGSGTSRRDLDGIFQKAKNAQYIPYVDVSKEYLNIADKCKPDEMFKNSIQGMYFLDTSETGKSAEQLNGCIKAGLSDKAVQQLRITGNVRYTDAFGNDDVASVAKGYQGILQGNNKAYSNMILQLNAEKDGLKKANTLTPDIEKAYDAEIKSLGTKITENLAASGKIDTGDYSDIEKDYDAAVGQVYGNQDVAGFAAAFSYRKYKEEYKVNQAAMTQFTQNNINARFDKDQAFDNFWNQKKFEQQERQNDISLLKSLTEGKTAQGATYQFLKGIYGRLGIPMDENITMMLDKGDKTTTGTTYDELIQKTAQYQHNKGQKALEIYNKMSDIVGGPGKEALNDGIYKDGTLDQDAVYVKAEDHLQNFYKTFVSKDKNGQSLPTPDYIQDLETLVNQYQDEKTKSIEFMKIKDQINASIDASPELKKIKETTDRKLQSLYDNYGKEGTLVSVKNSSGQETVLGAEDLRQLTLGTHPTYEFTREGSFHGGLIVVDKGTREKLQTVGSANVLEPYAKVYGDRTKNFQSALATKINEVVRNTVRYNVANLPGIGESLKQEFTFLNLPMENIDFQAGEAYKDKQGDLVVEVHAFETTGAGNDKATNSVNDQLIKALDESGVTTGGAFGNIKVVDGKLLVKTPYLPMAQPNYSLADIVSLKTYAASKQTLAPGQILEEQLKHVGGDFRIGFDIIGGGTEYPDRKLPNRYRAWLMLPDGTKETFGVETTFENQLSNQLRALEQQIPAQRAKFKQ